jgi:phytoene synthase
VARRVVDRLARHRVEIAVNSRKTTFYFSFLFLPGSQRRAIFAVFDFCRAVDDGVDLESDSRRMLEAVAMWRDEVARVFDGGSPATPQGRRLQPFVAPFRLPRDQFEALVDGVAMDATPRRYSTFADLEPYCHRVASSVGLICAAIFGAPGPEAAAYAKDLGVALQLTNILRDVGVDYRRGRCYLPLEDLARFGCSEQDIEREVERGGKGIESARVRAVLEHHAARARIFFSRAARALPRASARQMVAAEIMHAIYFELLKRIESSRYEVFGPLVRVPRPVQARVAIRTWWKLRRS